MAETVLPTRIKRSGTCTSYLEQILSPWLLHSSQLSQGIVDLKVFPKPSVTFRLPGSVAHPLILIGPGTGVAPFMGFLEHRAQIVKENIRAGCEACTGVWRGSFEVNGDDLPTESNSISQYIQSVKAGPIWLFFGCRDENDYLYKEQLQSHVLDGTLTALEVAMSRVGPDKVYVTHKMKARGAELAKLVLEDGAYIYICGDGNVMAKDVTLVIKDILRVYGGTSESDAEEIISDMKLRRRFVLDIWS